MAKNKYVVTREQGECCEHYREYSGPCAAAADWFDQIKTWRWVNGQVITLEGATIEEEWRNGDITITMADGIVVKAINRGDLRLRRNWHIVH